jgi:hypothetical protein
MRTLRILSFALLMSIPLCTAAAEAVRLEDLTVMALGALDGRAVLKGGDGKMQVVKVGDTIPGTHAVVTQVLGDKIVVQDPVVGADKSAKTQTVWISKPSQPGGKSTVQRLDSEAPPPRIVQGKVAQPVAAQPVKPKAKK